MGINKNSECFMKASPEKESRKQLMRYFENLSTEALSDAKCFHEWRFKSIQEDLSKVNLEINGVKTKYDNIFRDLLEMGKINMKLKKEYKELEEKYNSVHGLDKF